jgi:hypothetical protein
MTRDEFQHRYHDYKTDDSNEAFREAKGVNAEADGFTVVAVGVGSLGYGLMLLTAAVMAESAGVRQILTPEFVREEVKRRLLQLKTRTERRTCYMWFLLGSGWGKADIMQAADEIGLDERTGTLKLEVEVKSAVKRQLEEAGDGE